MSQASQTLECGTVDPTTSTETWPFCFQQLDVPSPWTMRAHIALCRQELAEESKIVDCLMFICLLNYVEPSTLEPKLKRVGLPEEDICSEGNISI